jgi:polyisoprenoid-binding protein YceI
VAVVSSIKRSDFGMTFGLPFVGDNIDLSFHLTAFRVKP